MPNSWFRLYAEWADDPKVQIMPEHMQRRLVMLFCERCNDETSQETSQEQLRAFHWRISPAELAETKALFLSQGFIDEGWNLLNWNKRQFLSDSSTERTRQYRQRLKQGETSHIKNGTLHETDVTGDVTPPDTDTDTEKKQKRTKKQKPSGDQRQADPRHSEFKNLLDGYWKSKNQIDMTWDGSEAKALSHLLSANPNLASPAFRTMLGHRWKSDVNHSDRPRKWLGAITSFASSPLDRFGQPLQPGGKQNGKSQSSTRADRTIDAAAAVIQRIEDRRSSNGNGAKAGSGGEREASGAVLDPSEPIPAGARSAGPEDAWGD